MIISKFDQMNCVDVNELLNYGICIEASCITLFCWYDKAVSASVSEAWGMFGHIWATLMVRVTPCPACVMASTTPAWQDGAMVEVLCRRWTSNSSRDTGPVEIHNRD